MKHHLISIILFAFVNISAICQNHFGGKLGVSFQFGTHMNRLGLTYQLYYINQFMQFGHGALIQYNFKSLGPPIKFGEAQFYSSVQVLWNESNKYNRHLLNEYVIMANKRNAAGYLWRYYLDQANTSQATGGVNVSSGQFTFIMENDFLGFYKGHHDKYRTGSWGVFYNKNDFLVMLQSTLWTGNANESVRILNSNYPNQNAYKDLSNAHFGKLSHGILALRLDGALGLGQTYRIESGIDAEPVRHFFQNKLIHDLIRKTHPSKPQRNPHVPMLQPNGMPYLYQPNQDIKPAEWYFQMGMNNFMFY